MQSPQKVRHSSEVIEDLKDINNQIANCNNSTVKAALFDTEKKLKDELLKAQEIEQAQMASNQENQVYNQNIQPVQNINIEEMKQQIANQLQQQLQQQLQMQLQEQANKYETTISKLNANIEKLEEENQNLKNNSLLGKLKTETLVKIEKRIKGARSKFAFEIKTDVSKEKNLEPRLKSYMQGVINNILDNELKNIKDENSLNKKKPKTVTISDFLIHGNILYFETSGNITIWQLYIKTKAGTDKDGNFQQSIEMVQLPYNDFFACFNKISINDILTYLETKKTTRSDEINLEEDEEDNILPIKKKKV